MWCCHLKHSGNPPAHPTWKTQQWRTQRDTCAHSQTQTRCHAKCRPAVHPVTSFACDRGRLSLKLHPSKCCVSISSFVLTRYVFTSQGIGEQAQWGPLDTQGCGFSWAGEGTMWPGWVVRGQTEERGDQMCFPDKITLVPAPLTQNTHRYQLAQGRQRACQPPPRAAGGISLCVCVCFCGCVCICRCSFKANKKGKGKTNTFVAKQTWNRGQIALSLSDNGELSELFLCQRLRTVMNTDELYESMSMLLLICAESSVLLPWQCPYLPCWRKWPIRPEDKQEEASDWLGTNIPLQTLPKQKRRRNSQAERQRWEKMVKGRHPLF